MVSPQAGWIFRFLLPPRERKTEAVNPSVKGVGREVPQIEPSEGTSKTGSKWEHPASPPGDEDSRDRLRVEAGTQ